MRVLVKLVRPCRVQVGKASKYFLELIHGVLQNKTFDLSVMVLVVFVEEEEHRGSLLRCTVYRLVCSVRRTFEVATTGLCTRLLWSTCCKEKLHQACWIYCEAGSYRTLQLRAPAAVWNAVADELAAWVDRSP